VLTNTTFFQFGVSFPTCALQTSKLKIISVTTPIVPKKYLWIWLLRTFPLENDWDFNVSVAPHSATSELNSTKKGHLKKNETSFLFRLFSIFR
jgi:hypothetical protein